MKSRDLFGRRLPLPILDRSAPFWRGDNAEVVLAKRLADREAEKAYKASQRRSKTRSPSTRSRTPVTGSPDLLKRLKRLQRNLPRRKTLAARQRIEAEIRQILAQLDEEQVG